MAPPLNDKFTVNSFSSMGQLTLHGKQSLVVVHYITISDHHYVMHLVNLSIFISKTFIFPV